MVKVIACVCNKKKKILGLIKFHVLIKIKKFLFLCILVEIKVKSRTVQVKGPRGTLSRSFKHLRLELKMIMKTKLRVDVWFATRKELACVRTICSHIQNMIKGVTYVSGPLNISVLFFVFLFLCFFFFFNNKIPT